MSVYPVSALVWPWMGGDGFLAGRAAVRLDLAAGAPPRPIDDTLARLDAWRASVPAGRFPGWIAVGGEPRLADNGLLLDLRVRGGARVWIWTDGAASMCDRTGRLPMWDHVCLRVGPVPPPAVRAERFDSVVVDPRTPPAAFLRLCALLDKRGFDGERYVLARSGEDFPAAGLVGADSRWRLTRPVFVAGAAGSPVRAPGHAGGLRDAPGPADAV